MSKDKIKEVAIRHFNQYGYHGVKMAQIAEEAGIRKQSLAYHFPSKTDLFDELYNDVVEEEIAFIHNFFLSNAELSWEEQLYQFLIHHKNRFMNDSGTNFMFVISFLPPMEGCSSVTVQYRRYLESLKKEVSLLFSRNQETRLTPEQCTQVYMTLLDGLDVQLVYESSAAYEQILELGWSVLLQGIREIE